MSRKCHFKIVEAKTRYWHWVFYCDGKPIAASAKSGKSQKQVADSLRIVMEGAANAGIQIAPMKLDEHVEAKLAEEGQLPATANDGEPQSNEGQSLPAAEAVEG